MKRLPFIHEVSVGKARGRKLTTRQATPEELARFAAEVAAKPADLFHGARLILPELEETDPRCPRLNFGNPCLRTDYHHHDEAFGGAQGKYQTMGSSPRPRGDKIPYDAERATKEREAKQVAR